MSKTWVVADPHFSHWGVCKFMAKNGVDKLRPWTDPDEMNSVLIKNWNDTVDDKDRVYLLGDVAMNKKDFMKAVPYLKGRIVLVKGNHDQEKLSFYTPWFDDIRAYVVKKGIIMSHIPIHPGSLSRWQFNIHGHLHDGFVRDANGNPDPRYICVSMEHTDYRPLDLQTILDKVVHAQPRES